MAIAEGEDVITIALAPARYRSDVGSEIVAAYETQENLKP